MATTRYFDGQTALPHEVGLRPTTNELVIFRPADSTVLARWPVGELRVVGDREHEALPPVACGEGDARLVVDDPGLRRQLALALPQLAPLATPRPSAARRIAQFGTALAVLVGLFWVAVDTGSQYAAPFVPHSLQARLGVAVRGELTAGHELCRGKAGVAAVNRLANRLAAAADYGHPVEVVVVKGGPVNAFTLPGGLLVLYSDLIAEARGGAELAGVVAHEIGHVVNHHSMRHLVRQYGLDLLLRLLTGGYSDLSTLGAGGSLLVALRNGRAYEREADASGVGVLEKLGLRADGVAGFFERMLEHEPKDAAAVAGIWSSHPPTAERIAATKRPATGAPPFSDTEWQAVRELCR